ncbi:hypothetical protein Pst134EA_001143 [Puccinia striiformis f. sp. tritici]|uniref:Uncharacterized protein n=1 Tax=Puccinia striiformis f. sp. tritici PST-78 TaxID=1165861 RepID=A0A0L0UVI9_9BASI|nr:hypothetical protein Pst134EA_001143 [Puccinia striiformis f. sp. tritici]KAH9474096.1 hypothetical protein Pst134EA_001143 [Puccinia striiformis f. sp. tritici]KAI9626030.1 hypothetical protein H4Q26_016018 [Puccinia striiformis f. sp. tritici PST-130]KNE90774.1 hypothetical protein PSTG_15781 [Puccinia striiformis f. sp. tritici PST-78]
MYVKVHRPASETPGVTAEPVDQMTIEDDSASPRPLPEQLPSIMFAIPFPKPTQIHGANKEAPPFLLYTFPRSVYQKPQKDPVSGKRGKEKLVKKLERKWQEEVKEGQEIKKGQHKDAGRLKRSKAAIVGFAASTIQRMPNNTMEVLARLPPPKKLGKVSIVYPEAVDVPWYDATILSEPQMQKSLWDLLLEAQKKAKTRIAWSGCLLPFTLALDILIIVPLFIFEINLAYFVTQLNGSRKAKHFADANKQATQNATPDAQDLDSIFAFKASPASRFTETIKHLYSICSTIDPVKFPIIEELPPPNYIPDKKIAINLIHEFKESVDSDVAARHVLDEEAAALDLDRALRKAAKEYVKRLS